MLKKEITEGLLNVAHVYKMKDEYGRNQKAVLLRKEVNVISEINSVCKLNQYDDLKVEQ